LSEFDDFQDLPEHDPDKLRKMMRRRAPLPAFRALLDVCQDPKAPAPAKATAATTLLRALGFFEKADDREEDARNMTAEELEAWIERMKAHAAALDTATAEEGQAATADTPEPVKPARKGKRKPPSGLFD
jgi:hypothetical protein